MNLDAAGSSFGFGVSGRRCRLEKSGFNEESKIMELFIDNAKTYVQLSAGALVLSITFLHEIAGVAEGTKVPTDVWLVVSWIFFLGTILCGAFYQYVAVKFLEKKFAAAYTFPLFGWLEDSPGWCYGAMLASFYAGCLCFAISAIRRI